MARAARASKAARAEAQRYIAQNRRARRDYVIDETIDGRILNGFHFRTADVHGAWIGKKTAQWIDKHYFAPVD